MNKGGGKVNLAVNPAIAIIAPTRIKYDAAAIFAVIGRCVVR
jgi:hypothetical protein